MNQLIHNRKGKRQKVNKYRYSAIEIMDNGSIVNTRGTNQNRAKKQLKRIVGKTTTMLNRLDRVVRNELLESSRAKATARKSTSAKRKSLSSVVTKSTASSSMMFDSPTPHEVDETKGFWSPPRNTTTLNQSVDRIQRHHAESSRLLELEKLHESDLAEERRKHQEQLRSLLARTNKEREQLRKEMKEEHAGIVESLKLRHEKHLRKIAQHHIMKEQQKSAQHLGVAQEVQEAQDAHEEQLENINEEKQQKNGVSHNSNHLQHQLQQHRQLVKDLRNQLEMMQTERQEQFQAFESLKQVLDSTVNEHSMNQENMLKELSTLRDNEKQNIKRMHQIRQEGYAQGYHEAQQSALITAEEEAKHVELLLQDQKAIYNKQLKKVNDELNEKCNQIENFSQVKRREIDNELQEATDRLNEYKMYQKTVLDEKNQLEKNFSSRINQIQKEHDEVREKLIKNHQNDLNVILKEKNALVKEFKALQLVCKEKEGECYEKGRVEGRKEMKNEMVMLNDESSQSHKAKLWKEYEKELTVLKESLDRKSVV